MRIGGHPRERDFEIIASISMTISIEELLQMPDKDLLSAYQDARQKFVKVKFERDSQRARLQWLRAKAFLTASGGVTERQNFIEASEELGRKGQDVREMTPDLDLLKVEVDVLLMIVGLRSKL